jgi:DNA mismatch endonuclease (patch repair protein)
MQGNRSTDTRPEVAIRSALHRAGLRFLKNSRPESGLPRADVLFPRARLAVFIDGCFWHCCPEHGTSPRTNGAYWRAKLDGNVARDRRNDAALADAGWNVVRIWEHEEPSGASQRVQRTYRKQLSRHR